MKTNANATQETTMSFTKQSFMGIELDILIGHPEHDILFIATQVARAAGLKDPATAVSDYRKLRTHEHVPGEALQALIGNLPVSLPKEPNGRAIRKTTVLFTEPMVYQMLLRGHAPASEPFRKWVTEEVLPSIRKTGAYNVNESTTKEGMQFSGELAQLHDVIKAMLKEETSDIRAMLKELLERPVAGTEPSPYEGTTMSSLSDNLLFDKRTFREVGESIGLIRPGIDKLEPYVLPVP